MDFSERVCEVAAGRGMAVPNSRHPEVLASHSYADELGIKNEALAAFWRDARLPSRPEPIVAAPRPRGYRTTTKRRAEVGRRGLCLEFPGAAAGKSRVSPSALDLAEHGAVYAALLDRLRRPGARALASALNHTIVRGEASALAVILNVRVFDAAVVRAAKRIAEALQEPPLGVRSAFLYLDPTGSDYYLEARRPAGTLSFKRLFGPEWLQVEVGGVRLRFPPTVFSQVNTAMLATMADTVARLLGDLAGRALLDLYCGYGLFSLTIGRTALSVLGVDLDGPAIEAARGNAAHTSGAERVRFLAGRIDAEFLSSRVRHARAPELVLLDPPRQGTAPGVAAALAARRPERIVHICCGADEIPREVQAWAEAGYTLRRAVPLDLFAGTAAVETLLLLER